MRSACLGILVLSLGIAAEEEKRGTPPLVTLAGAASAIGERTYHRVTTREELVNVWLRHVGADPEKHSEYYNVAGVPEVDFERCMVVAVFGGASINSAGIYASSVTEEKDRVLLRFDHRSYQSMGEGNRVTPFGFFFVPRSGKELVLEEDVQNLIGGAPEWKERARFEATAR